MCKHIQIRSISPICLDSARTGLFGLRCVLSPLSGRLGSPLPLLISAPAISFNRQKTRTEPHRPLLPSKTSRVHQEGHTSTHPAFGVTVEIKRYRAFMPNVPRHMVTPRKLFSVAIRVVWTFFNNTSKKFSLAVPNNLLHIFSHPTTFMSINLPRIEASSGDVCVILAASLHRGRNMR
ncbi:hypothetical protein Agabi119p4_8587 [Agaricus bisporus var. burnettii]|uniref:Uncharacterized protein n=1 Tax=Agaricus bisporus var. burnettii TaxID=192524 RepID=A0A8H7C7D6_AGABI|nr:hypothetical protein Agabi119p4_8587 [Agaricus bisporus var. burnettii]